MRILHISCSYFPYKIGGTEVYICNLADELIGRGHKVFISYVNAYSDVNKHLICSKDYIFKEAPVFVIEKHISNFKTKDLYFDDGTHLDFHQMFKEYLKKIQPDIVHFHHFSPTDVITQMGIVKEMNLPIILTYHTPMMTCGHSDMLYLGRRPCDGKFDYKRCLICTQTKYRIPFSLAWIWASLPKYVAKNLGYFIGNTGLNSRFATWLQLPWLTGERIKRWEAGFKMIDHFVAVSLWVYELLLRNNVPPERITLCRQGVGSIPSIIKRQKDNTLRLGYIGRIHSVKGIDVLLKAFKWLSSDFRIELYIYASEDKGEKVYHHKLFQQSSKDNRIKWVGPVPEKDKFQVLSQLDALIIPSRWLEAGPLVLLEAWAVGTPVIGAKLGGIAELLKDGIGGLLFKPNDARDLAKLMMGIYQEPDLLKKLKTSIPKVRTMKEVADDMCDLYHRLTR